MKGYRVRLSLETTRTIKDGLVAHKRAIGAKSMMDLIRLMLVRSKRLLLLEGCVNRDADRGEVEE